LALFFSRTGLYAVDPKTGEQQFFVRWRARINASVNAATPIVSGNRVFISSAYNTGALLLKVTAKGAEKVWTSDDALTNHFNTSVLHQGYLFGVDGRQDLGDVKLACIELATGKRQWIKEGLGCANLILVGDRILACCENGELVWFAADPAGFRELARTAVLTGVCRPAPALADGKLYFRNENELICFDLQAK
jgi:outer membrane protein assembly factor BamB